MLKLSVQVNIAAKILDRHWCYSYYVPNKIFMPLAKFPIFEKISKVSKTVTKIMVLVGHMQDCD